MSDLLGFSIGVVPIIGIGLWMAYEYLVVLPRQEREAEEDVKRYNDDPNRRGPKHYVEWR